MPMLTDRIRFNRIIFRDQVFTQEYCVKAIDECARHLDKNIRSNSPIVYCVAPNHIKTIIGFLAIVKSGRAALLVDPKTGKLEYEEMLADTMPSAIIRIDPETLEFDLGKEIELTDYRMDPALVRELDDVCILLYTAAEDGYAKAAMLTHHNIRSNALAIAEETGVHQQSISCVLLPFNHLYGFQNSVVVPLVAGNSELICTISDILKVNLIAGEISRCQVSHIYSVPLIYYLLSRSPHIERIGRQAYMLMSGGYKLPASLRERFERKLTIPIYEGYGLTEASPAFTCQSPGKQFEKASIGRPMVNYVVKIVDDTGNEVAFGEKGEIWFQGDTIMKGYFNHPEATRQKISDGWLRTGDYGKQDKNGNVFFLGLKKKMFNVAGNKVYPEEVKRLMMKNGNVETVDFRSDYEALTGDSIKAKVRFKTDSPSAMADLRTWCSTMLTKYKIPASMTSD